MSYAEEQRNKSFPAAYRGRHEAADEEQIGPCTTSLGRPDLRLPCWLRRRREWEQHEATSIANHSCHFPIVSSDGGRRRSTIQRNCLKRDQHRRELECQWRKWGQYCTGKISDTGLYTAPATVPDPATVTINAASQQDPLKTGSATVTIANLGAGVNNVLLSGRYAFIFVGSEKSAGVFVAGGTFLADGNGNITDGLEDGNFAGGIFAEQPFTAQSISGTLTLDANGRGTATLTTPIGQLHFAYYIVSNEEILLVGSDFFPILSGTGLRQTASPFSDASLLGKYIFVMTASTHDRPQKVIRADAGVLQADGAGQLSNGVLDRNSPSGVVSGSAVTGTYSITPDGRGTATLSTGVGDENIVFYMTSPSEGFALQVDPSTTANNVTSGGFIRQDTSSFSATSWQGPYGLSVTGSSIATNPTNISGVLSADGVGALTSLQDVYDSSLNADVSVNGTYAVQTTGQGTASFPTVPTNFNVYFASDSYIVLIGMDPGQVRFGTALKQK
jgi:hypothetical protein